MDENQTDRNLREAFAGEAKACLRLRAYAEKAEEEELNAFARLFRAISAAEAVHALKHLQLIEEVEDTQTNLEKSFERETSVTDNVYPEMIKTAAEEGNKPAQITFTHARDAEEFHAQLYKKALDHLMEDEDVSYHVCSVCGYVADGELPEHCPICNAPKDKFFQVD